MKDYTRASVITDAILNGGEYNTVYANIKEDYLTAEDSEGNEIRLQYSAIKVKRDNRWNVSAWYEGERLGKVWWEKGRPYE